MMMKIPLLLLLSLLLAGNATARGELEELEAAIDQDEFGYDESADEPWKEQVSQIPPVSLDALMQMQIDHGPEGVVFYLDRKSIAMNEKDRITRYWLVAKSNGNIVDINFEALRCSNRQYKQLAYSTPAKSGEIRMIENPRWRRIRGRSMRDYHAEIADTYICAGSTPKTYEGVIASLKGNYDSYNPYSEYNDL
ncbi:MAG: CNP1-like family protein [Chromatiales bacterium]